MVLLVEDETAVRRVAGRILTTRLQGDSPPPTGARASPRSRATTARLTRCFTDVVMPALDGAALAREVRFPEARVLFASGYCRRVDHPARRGRRGRVLL